MLSHIWQIGKWKEDTVINSIELPWDTVMFCVDFTYIVSSNIKDAARGLFS